MGGMENARVLAVYGHPDDEGQVTGTMAAFILALHLIGWFTLVVIVAPEHYSVGSRTFGIGMGVTAYTLGMRHAFDADHIAAIDNATRKLMSDGQRPMSVGFWFSLGHSSVVFAMVMLLAMNTAGVQLLPPATTPPPKAPERERRR